jgi:O-antigen ligase
MSARTLTAPVVRVGAAVDVDLPTVLFVVSAFIAPLNLNVVRAFTAYDLLTAGIFLLLVWSSVPMIWAPRSMRLAAIVLMMAGMLGGFRSTVPIQSVLQVIQYAFVFFVVLPVVLTIARTRAIVYAALASFLAGYLVVISIAFATQRVQLAGRVVPFFNSNPNALAIPTVIAVPFVLCFALLLWRRGFSLTALAAAGLILTLMLWSLTASASRGSTAATMVSLIVFAVFRDGIPSWGRIALRVSLVVVALLVVGAAVYWTNIFPDTLRTRIERTIGPDAAGQTVSDDRFALDRAGLRAFFASPIVGTGFDNFRYVGQFYDDAATFHDPHNLWVQFLAQSGIFGAAAFAFIIVRWFVLVLRTQSRVRAPDDVTLLWAFVAAMAGLMCHSMLAPLVLQRHYWLLYALGIAAAVELGRRAQDTGASVVMDRQVP